MKNLFIYSALALLFMAGCKDDNTEPTPVEVLPIVKESVSGEVSGI